MESRERRFFCFFLTQSFLFLSTGTAYVAGLINMSIPQTFVSKVIDNKLVKDDKEKRISLKC